MPQTHILTKGGVLQTITVPAGSESRGIGFGIESFQAPEYLAEAKGDQGKTGGKMAVMGEVDSARFASVAILERDGIYYVSLRDWSMLFDAWSPMRCAFRIWMNELPAEATVVIDSYQGITGASDLYDFMAAMAQLGIIKASKAKIISRVCGLQAGIGALIALISDEIQVGQVGELVLMPYSKLGFSKFTVAHQPFLEDTIYGEAKDRGLLTEEELTQLTTAMGPVVLTRDMLIERGATAIGAA